MCLIVSVWFPLLLPCIQIKIFFFNGTVDRQCNKYTVPCTLYIDEISNGMEYGMDGVERKIENARYENEEWHIKNMFRI